MQLSQLKCKTKNRKFELLVTPG